MNIFFKTSAPEATVDGLIEGNLYQFRVRALNKAGPSEASDATEPHLAKHKNRKIVFNLRVSLREKFKLRSFKNIKPT